MASEIQIARLEALRLMILELAKGNFSYRIPLVDHNDEIQDFEILLNLLAEELGGFFVYSDSFHQKNITDPFVFVVDASFRIFGFNTCFREMLGYSEDGLLQQPLTRLMPQKALQQLQQQISSDIDPTAPDKNSLKTILHFYTPSQQTVTCWGYCHRIGGAEQDYYFFRGLPISYDRENPSNPVAFEPIPSYASLQLQADIQKIRAVHQFVMENLHGKLPPLTSLARMFHLNEFKLKTGFKELYQTTIFKLHLEKRLELAMHMIKYTPTSLKVVANSHGFKSLSHFSRAFKKKYGESPSYFKHRRG